MGTIRFELRAVKTDKQGKAPLRIIYQIKGERKFYSTGLKLFPCQWDAKKQVAVYLDKKSAKQVAPDIRYDDLRTAREVEAFNQDLSDYAKRINAIEKRYELDGIVYTTQMVLDKLKAGEQPKAETSQPKEVLFDFIDYYVENNRATREKASLKIYQTLKFHLQDYQTHTRKKITFDGIDYAFFQSFQNFLIEKHKYFPEVRHGERMIKSRPLNNTTIAKQLSTVKTFLGYAKANGIRVSDNYKNFKIKKESLEVIALTNEEFESLFYLDLTANKRLSQVRDVFCLACATGLRYSDLNQLRREHIKNGEIGITIKKTKEHLTIPLTPYSNAILDRYNAQHKPIPVISNQKLNSYLKELCKMAGICEPVEIVRFRGAKREANTYPKHDLISVHTGRKTFATLSLEKGMSAEEVMAITGHKSYQSFKRYVKITEQRKKVVMLKAWSNKTNDIQLKVI